MARILEPGYFHNMIGQIILHMRSEGRVFVWFSDEYMTSAWFDVANCEFFEE